MQQPSAISVLVVHDSELARTTLATMLAREGYSVDVSSFAEGPQRAATGKYSIVLCDGATGMGAQAIRLITREAPHVPVVAVVHVGDPLQEHRARAMGATEVAAYPFGVHDLPIAIERALHSAGLWNRACSRTSSSGEADETALDSLLSAIRTKAADPHENPERVAAYALEIATALGLPDDLQADIARGALLHDVGKLAIPDAILLKPAPLTQAEWQEVQAHPVIGYRMCARIPTLRKAAEIVLHHHERWDGLGYPDGLFGMQIPLGARIVAAAAAFDAMTAGRAYRNGVSVKEALEEIARCAATQFDPQIAAAFAAVPEAQWRGLISSFKAPLLK